jgi:tetratricopeptide (TPR) repeat protein
MRTVLRLLGIVVVLAAITITTCSSPSAEARSLEAKGDLKGAVALYQEALQRDPNDLKTLAPLAVDLWLLGEYEAALPFQERVVALDRKDAQTRVELAFNYLNHQKQPAKAVEFLKQAVALQPSAKNLTFLAEAQIVASDSSGAEQSLDKALKTDPKYAFTYVVLLSLLTSENRTADAAKLREQAGLNGVDLSQVSGS